MKIERSRKKSAEVFTASLNDIMFFLLLFFLIISTFITPTTIRVLLPQAQHAESSVEKKSVNLTVTNDLRYFINDMEISLNQVEPELSKILESNKGKETSVVLQADKTIDLQHAVDLIDIGNKLGVKMVLFIKKPK